MKKWIYFLIGAIISPMICVILIDCRFQSWIWIDWGMENNYHYFEISSTPWFRVQQKDIYAPEEVWKQYYGILPSRHDDDYMTYLFNETHLVVSELNGN